MVLLKKLIKPPQKQASTEQLQTILQPHTDRSISKEHEKQPKQRKFYSKVDLFKREGVGQQSSRCQTQPATKKHFSQQKTANRNQQQPKRSKLQETKSNSFDTTHRPNRTRNFLVSSPNIAQTPLEDPTSRAIGGCRLS
jgi:hypothetical protein